VVLDGNVTFRFPTAHSNSAVLAVPGAGLSADLTIESGSLTLLQNLYLGQVAGHAGTLSITGAGTSVTASSAAGATSVGDQGEGTLNVLDGASLTLENSPEFGDRAGGLGSLAVSGVSATSPFPRAQLIVHNGASDPVEFGSNGTGNGGVLFGARMEVLGSMVLGKNPGGVGTFSIAGFDGADSARLEIAGDLEIARNDVAGTAAGTGTFLVSAEGIAEVAGTTYTHDPDGGIGKLQLREGGRFETGSLDLSDPATQLDFTGGLLQVRGGSLVTGGQPLTVNSATGTPALELHDGALSTINSAIAPALTVGEDASGTLRLFNGSGLTVRDFNAIVGDDPGSDGRLELSDPGTALAVDRALLVGRAGEGRFEVSNEAQCVLFSLGVATQPGSNGRVAVRDNGTDVVVADLFEVAGVSAGGSGALGLVTVTNDANLWLDRPGISGHVWETGEVVVSAAAALRLTGSLVNRGRLAILGGSTDGGAIQPIGGGILTAYGSVHSSIFAVADTLGRVEATVLPPDPLTIGDEASTLGVHFLGTLDLNAGNDVTLLDADSAVVGTVLLGGGTLNGPAGGIHVSVDRRVTGNGRITGPIRPAGRIIASGAEGIAFTGPVLGVGQGMNGTRLRFAPGGSFVGYGRLEASVQVDSGAAILPTGDVTLGRAPLTSALTLDGTLAVGPGIEVDVEGTDSTRVNGLITLVDGYLANLGTSPLAIRPAGRITGNGTVTGATVNGGTIEPGPGTGELVFETLLMLGSSTIAFEVGDYAAGDMDTLTGTGSLTAIGGTLDLRTLPGFVAVPGDSFLVLSYVSHTGSFADVTVNGAPSAAVEIVYHPTGAWVRILGDIVDVPAAPAAAGFDRVRLSALGSPSRSPAFAVELPEAARVTLDLFDVGGRRVARLQDGDLAAGRHRFDAGSAMPASAGLFFARATVSGPRGTEVRTVRVVRTP
jgi:T5SS/PEP-CTERM-associated repeat protein